MVTVVETILFWPRERLELGCNKRDAAALLPSNNSQAPLRAIAAASYGQATASRATRARRQEGVGEQDDKDD